MQTTEVVGNVTYSYRIGSTMIDSVKINGIEVKGHIYRLLKEDIKITTVNNNHFSRYPYKIEFSNEIKQICTEIFESIKQLKKNANEELAGKAASHIFEAFADYWESDILKKREQLVGIEFWREILAIINEWEFNSDITLHKGTPYFFLAENYLLAGDRDAAFIYLYNAIEADIIWGNFVPSSNYPDDSPAYVTATMRRGKNQMDYLVEPWRNKLNEYIEKFNALFDRNFKLEEHFDRKFLSNKQLSNVVYFFVFNFIYLYEITSYTESKLLRNQFSRLRTLDLIFNLCLIIDETLKNSQSSSDIRQGIICLCQSKGWMKQCTLVSFWDDLHVPYEKPDIVLRRLLSKEPKKDKDGNPVSNEVYTLSIAYNLRNYGGHNISQQCILISKFDEIIEQLLMSLFLCIDV